MFEIAGFLHSRELRDGIEGTESKSRRLDIRPTWAAPCTVAIAVSLFGAMLALLTVPFSNPIIGISIFGILVAMCFHIAAESLRNYNRCIDKLQFELKSFDIQEAQCYCCSVNHVNPFGPNPMSCDREIIGQCISNWFDSMLNFNECVRSTVFANLIEQLLHGPFPAPLLMNIAFLLAAWFFVFSVVRFLSYRDKRKTNPGLVADRSVDSNPLGSA